MKPRLLTHYEIISVIRRSISSTKTNFGFCPVCLICVLCSLKWKGVFGMVRQNTRWAGELPCWWRGPREVACAEHLQAGRLPHACCVATSHACVSGTHTLPRSPNPLAPQQHIGLPVTCEKGCWGARPELGRRNWPFLHRGEGSKARGERQGPQEESSLIFFFKGFKGRVLQKFLTSIKRN